MVIAWQILYISKQKENYDNIIMYLISKTNNLFTENVMWYLHCPRYFYR